jgi:hypothetical protein
MKQPPFRKRPGPSLRSQKRVPSLASNQKSEPNRFKQENLENLFYQDLRDSTLSISASNLNETGTPETPDALIRHEKSATTKMDKRATVASAGSFDDVGLHPDSNT